MILYLLTAISSVQVTSQMIRNISQKTGLTVFLDSTSLHGLRDERREKKKKPVECTDCFQRKGHYECQSLSFSEKHVFLEEKLR